MNKFHKRTMKEGRSTYADTEKYRATTPRIENERTIKEGQRWAAALENEATGKKGRKNNQTWGNPEEHKRIVTRPKAKKIIKVKK